MTNKKLPTINDFKQEAKELRIENPEITSHGAALNILAKSYGFKNWNTIRPKLLEIIEIDPVWTPERSTF